MILRYYSFTMSMHKTVAVIARMIQASLLIPGLWNIPPCMHTWCEVSDGVRSMKLGAEGDCGGEEDEEAATAAVVSTADDATGGSLTAASFPLIK